MRRLDVNFGVDIETREAKKLMAIVKRFCKAYDFKLITLEGPYPYTQDRSLAQILIKLEVIEFGQFKKGFEAEYITGLFENCVYLQCNCMFNCFKPIVSVSENQLFWHFSKRK